MLTFVLAVVVGAPIPLSTLIRDADSIVVATVVEVDKKAQRSTLEVESVIRGAAERRITTPVAIEIGDRGIFFLSRKFQPQLLWLAEPGQLGNSPSRVTIDVKPLRPRPGSGVSERVPLKDVLKILGKPDLELLPSVSAFSTATCDACSLDKTVADLKAKAATVIDCDSAPNKRRCFESARASQSAVMLSQSWNGIDSGGTELLIATPDFVRAFSYESDVTGGTEPECCAAVFSTVCMALEWNADRFSCYGVHSTECSEWENQRTVLHEGRPTGELRCDYRGCQEPLLCRKHKDGAFLCSPR